MYDLVIEVEFHHFLRPEAKFASIEEMMTQIGRDCVKARELLASVA